MGESDPRTPRRLTDRGVAALAPGPREYAVADAALPGLALRVRPTGAKAWVWRGRLAGRKRRVTLGAPPAMTVAEARAAAARVALGGPEAAPAIRRRRSPRFDAFVETFLARHAAPRWTPETLRSGRVYLDSQLLPAFGARPLDAIRHADVARWFYAYGARRPGGANRALTILETIFNAAIRWGALPEDAKNPCVGLPAFRRPKVGRALTGPQLARLGAALAEPPCCDDPAAAAVRLILLTGCRSGEILRARKADVDGRRLRLSSGKTGPRAVPLGPEAVALLRDLPRRHEAAAMAGRGLIAGRSLAAAIAASPWLFPNPADPARPRPLPRYLWARLKADADLPPALRLHDLRHTYASAAIGGGETLQTAGALLGHRRYSTTQIYAHLDDADLVAAGEIVGAAVAEAMGV